MTKKAFSICRIVAVAIVTVIVSAGINLGNWYLPVAAIVASWVFLYLIRHSIREVVADERDYLIAGKSSSSALKAYLIVSVIAGIILYTMGKNDNEVLFNIATTLLYSACFLMVFQAVSFKIYERKDENT